jgi:signal transduction histidine kinase/DNA-binding NarL/FixJ family response regulator/HPt (histidine-containing phosphotransfer) domain-containing protein
MMDATPIACSIRDEDSNVIDCNEEAVRLFGVKDKAEFAGRIRELNPEIQPDGERSDQKMKRMDKKVQESGYERFEWMHLTAQGELLPVETTLKKILLPGVGFAAYSRDLREIKAKETQMQLADKHSRELEIATKAAYAASEAKSSFLASMSHEIRTPMNAIIGMSELMRTDNLDKQQLDFFSDIQKMSHALLQVINDILDFSKIESNKMDLNPANFDLLALIDNIVSMHRFIAEGKDLKLTFCFDPDVKRFVYADDVRIRQILNNILSNAIKYTMEGSVDFQVKPITENGKDYIAFIVKDTGLGIKKEDLPRIFDKFEQLDVQKNRNITGTGLGLPITKRLVDMMEGSIDIQSEYGIGSTFTILLPFKEGNPHEITDTQIKLKVIARDTVKVLVVDDNSINLKVAAAYLSKNNIIPDTALSGAEAISMVQKKKYHMIFMDHMMPGMDGVETTQAIRDWENKGHAQHIPIIALSANAVSGARSLFLKSGMDDFISKPIDVSELNQVLALWLPVDLLSFESKTFQKPGSEPEISGKQEAREEIKDTKTNPGEQAEASRIGSGLLDYAMGLSNCAGDEKLYRQLLADFSPIHKDDIQKINDNIAKKEFETARRIAHTLKSTSTLLGSRELNKAALAVENALTEKMIQPAEPLLSALKSAFDEVLVELSLIAEKNKTISTQTEHTLDKAGALALIEKLKPLLENSSTSCFDLIDTIQDTFGPIGDECRQLLDKIRDFEFIDALEILAKIGDIINNGK